MKKESLFAFVATIAVMLAVSSCEKDVTEIVISDDKQIDELMEEQSLTSFLTILDISGLRSTVHAYGNYALFAPTNEAVDMYLQQVNKASVTALTHEEAANIVKYHLLNISDKKDSLTTKDFVDGRMSYPNFAGTYLTTKQEGEDIRINLLVTDCTPDFSRLSIQHIITKPGDVLAATIHTDIAWLDTVRRKMTIPPEEVIHMLETFPGAGKGTTGKH